jgi:hypothetical protein
MRLTLRSCVLAVCAFAASLGIARADIAPKWSDDDLARFADAIVTGRVTDISTGRDGTGAIYTYVAVAVDRVMKGDIAEREVVVKQLGGVIGDDGLGIADQATFSRGEEVLLFLETRPRDHTLYTSALWQGKWTINRDAATGDRIAVRQQATGDLRGMLRGEPERRALDTFMGRLMAAGAAARTGADRGFVVAPAAEELKAAAREQASGGAPYALFSPPWRWNEFDTGAAIPVDIMGGGQPGLAGGGGNELVRAATTWSTPTGLRFVAGGLNTSRCSSESGPNGRITIVYMDPCGEISNSGGTLAYGGAWFSGTGGVSVNGVAFRRALSGFIVNNDSSTALQFLQNSGCFASVETHELGHVLGLDHSASPSAIMYPSVSFSSCSASPTPISGDDVAGIQFIYAAATGSAPAPGTPRSLFASSSGSTVTLSWLAPATGGTPAAYIVEAGSSSGLANLANFSTGNTSTIFTAAGVGAATYYIRVKATNAAGTSTASNEALLVVGSGPCIGPPGSPTGFILTGNSGGTVSFIWGASSGSPTTYIIEAGSTPGATNLANSDLGSSATVFTAFGVGRGTYYVRLRGRNSCGTSGPSNEVTLVVP